MYLHVCSVHPLPRSPVTTRIIEFSVKNPKPSFASVNWGVNPIYLYFIFINRKQKRTNRKILSSRENNLVFCSSFDKDLPIRLLQFNGWIRKIARLMKEISFHFWLIVLAPFWVDYLILSPTSVLFHFSVLNFKQIPGILLHQSQNC